MLFMHPKSVISNVLLRKKILLYVVLNISSTLIHSLINVSWSEVPRFSIQSQTTGLGITLYLIKEKKKKKRNRRNQINGKRPMKKQE